MLEDDKYSTARFKEETDLENYFYLTGQECPAYPLFGLRTDFTLSVQWSIYGVIKHMLIGKELYLLYTYELIF